MKRHEIPGATGPAVALVIGAACSSEPAPAEQPPPAAAPAARGARTASTHACSLSSRLMARPSRAR